MFPRILAALPLGLFIALSAGANSTHQDFLNPHAIQNVINNSVQNAFFATTEGFQVRGSESDPGYKQLVSVAEENLKNRETVLFAKAKEAERLQESDPEAAQKIRSEISKPANKDQEKVRFDLNIGYTRVGLSRADGKSKADMSGYWQASVEIVKTGTEIIVGVYPGAILGLGTIRKGVEEEFEYGAYAAVAKIFHTTPDKVDELASKSPMAAQVLGLAKEKAKKGFLEAKKTRLTLTNALKAASIFAVRQRLTESVTLSVGKNYLKPFERLVPEATSLIISAVPNVTGEYDTEFATYSISVFSDRGTFLNRSQFAETVVRKVVEEGDDFFKIKADSWLFNADVKRSALEALGLGWVTVLMAGGGHRVDEAFAYLTTDMKFGRLKSETMLYVSSHRVYGKNFIGTQRFDYDLSKRWLLGTKGFYSANRGTDTFGAVSGSVGFRLKKISVPLLGERELMLVGEAGRGIGPARDHMGFREGNKNEYMGYLFANKPENSEQMTQIEDANKRSANATQLIKRLFQNVKAQEVVETVINEDLN
jgi:hypothetical protein